MKQQLRSSERHVRYFKRCLQQLPGDYVSMEPSRLTLIWFCLAGLDILRSPDVIDTRLLENLPPFLKSLSVGLTISSNDNQLSVQEKSNGFCGYFGSPFMDIDGYKCANLAATYSALLVVKIISDHTQKPINHFISKDDLIEIMKSLKHLQQPDGSFVPCRLSPRESDLRFVFCACAILFICHQLLSIAYDTKFDMNYSFDVVKAVEFIRSCQSYDGGFGQRPGLESHGGSTYCALASLELLNRTFPNHCLPVAQILDVDRVTRWLIMRQTDVGGFQGRINKPADTCYSFWIGASLQILICHELIDKDLLTGFLGETEHEAYGGYGKERGDLPDLLHSYMALAGQSIFCPKNSEISVSEEFIFDGALNYLIKPR